MFITSVVTLTKREGAVLKIMGPCYNHLARGDYGEILRNPKAIGVRAFLYTPEQLYYTEISVSAIITGELQRLPVVFILDKIWGTYSEEGCCGVQSFRSLQLILVNR